MSGIAGLESRIASLIAPRREQMIADLARWVAIPTGRNHASGLDEFRGLVVDRLTRLGASRELVPGDGRPEWLASDEPDAGPFLPPPTVVCRGPKSVGKRILLAGHLDTVFDPAGAFRAMTIAADGKTAIGPGVVDMKGGILVAVVALEALAEAAAPVSWTFLLNSDEETGSYASERALRSEAKKHDIGIAMEPALPGGGLAAERKGSGQFLIEAFGRSAHAGRDFEKGVSAVYSLARALTKVEGFSDLPRGVTVNVGPLKGGAATNVVPDFAAAWGNARFPDSAASERLQRQLESLRTESDAMPRIDVKLSFNRPAKPLIPATRVLAEEAKRLSESMGRPMVLASTGGVCDGNILQDAGLPTIDTLGVRGGGLHTEQEWIELDSLTERATLLACLLTRLSAAVA